MLSPRVRAPESAPHLGLLAAAGPRAAANAGEYALLVETIREGWLAHYGDGTRVLSLDDDPDLALLAGDYLYSRGLERLAVLGDLEAITEFADLISLLASGPGETAVNEAWLGTALAVGCGASEAYRAAKLELRDGRVAAPVIMRDAVAEMASEAGISDQLSAAVHALGFHSP